MDKLLEQLEDKAAAALETAKDLDEFTRIAQFSKVVAEAKKANGDARNQSKVQSKQLRLEGLKSWATLLVPIVSVLTLAGTLFIQSRQLAATLRQNEDTQWREFLTSVDAARKDNAASITLAPRLLSFLNSDRYRSQAQALAVNLIGQITNDAGFRSLYESIMTQPGAKDIPILARVARTLTSTKFNVQSDCVSLDAGRKEFLGLCSFEISDQSLLSIVAEAGKREKAQSLRRSLVNVTNQLVFVTDEIAALLRSRQANPTFSRAAPGAMDLSQIHFMGGDFSNLSFSDYDLTNTLFNQSRVDEAVFIPARSVGLQFPGTAWWKARKLDRSVFALMVQYGYPYYAPGVAYPAGDEPTEHYWKQRVAALCVPVEEFCEERSLKLNAPGVASPASGPSVPTPQ